MLLTKISLLFFGNNWRIILISLVVATIFWLFNALNKDYSTRIDYPIQFNFKRDSVVVVDQLPEIIAVDVSGGGWDLIRKIFLFNADPVMIDLNNPTETKFITQASLLPVVRERLSSLNIDFIVNDTLFINIEPIFSKNVKVVVDSLAIPLNENFRLISKVLIQPDSITVEGPKSMIDTLSSEYRITFTQNNIDDEFNDAFEIAFAHRLIRPLPDEVIIRFDTDEFNRASIPIPIETTNFPGDSSIYIMDSVIQVYYTSRNRDLDKIRESDFSITADLNMLNGKDSTIIPILIAFPSYAMEIELQLDSLKVVYGGR